MKFKLNGAKGNQRRKGALKRLEAQLSSFSIRPDSKEKDEMQKTRIEKEINTLKDRIR